jgi:hypothetical protein
MVRRLACIAVAAGALGLTFAVGHAARAETAAPPKADKWCWINAKTGKPVQYRAGATLSNTPRSKPDVIRIACPSGAPRIDAAAASQAPIWLSAPGALLVKAAPPAATTWWASAEALIWSVKSAPLPPTLTTFAPGSLSATTGSGGELGVPGTIILSPSQLGYDVAPGGRFTLGHWLDPNQTWGLEGEGFFLGSQSAGFSDTSGGTPPLRVPFTNVPPGAGFPIGSSSFVLAEPGFASGGQVVSSSLQLWGLEGNGIYHALNFRPVSVSLLGGIRYLDLREGLTIASSESLLPPFAGSSFTGTDNFATHNQFVGPQIGAKAETEIGRFDGSVLGKVAFGDNYQTVSANGTSSVTGFGLPAGTTPGGIFTQATNIGTRMRNQFAVVPEVQVQLGYRVLDRVHLFVAYDFLYVSNVVRPGDQIDTTLNLTGNPAISGPGAVLTGAARPAPQFNNSSFWAQGANLGLRYDF